MTVDFAPWWRQRRRDLPKPELMVVRLGSRWYCLLCEQTVPGDRPEHHAQHMADLEAWLVEREHESDEQQPVRVQRPVRPLNLSCDCCKYRDPTAPPPLVSKNPANFCTVCGLDFSTSTAHEEHFVGEYEPYDRRCLTVAELEADGWRHDRHGRWRLPIELEPRLVERVHL